LITRIAIIGICVITCSLVILLSAFNGMEKLIDRIYSEFDPSITITPASGKTFFEQDVDWESLSSVDGIKVISKGHEELVVLEYSMPLEEEMDYRVKRTNARLYGVEDSFLELIQAKTHSRGDKPVLRDSEGSKGIIGIGLIQKLEASLNSEFTIFIPKKNIKMSSEKPFFKKKVKVSSVLVYQNRLVNEETFLWPLSEVRKLTKDTSNTLTHIYVRAKSSSDLDDLKTRIQKVLGNDFVVKTYLQKNELVFKTSKSEKLILTLILIFVFILACFNLVSSITMIYLEKKENFKALKSMGLTNKGLFRVFYFQGLQISLIGVFLGGLIGYTICWLQSYFEFFYMAPEQPYPIGFSWVDFLTIITAVSLLSVLFSYVTVKLLMRKELKA